MTTVREVYEALKEILDLEGGSEILIASQPSWPMQNHVAGVQLVEFVEDHPFEHTEDSDAVDICGICGQHREVDDHQMKRQVYIVEGDQCEDSPYLPGEAKEQLGW